MGIIFKKNGRPSKAEKALVKNINQFLSSLDENERAKYDFADETVNDPNRLQEIWDVIVEKPTQPPEENLEPETQEEPQEEQLNVDEETGEIKEDVEKTQEDSNFVNNSEPMEEANIEEESNDLLDELGTDNENVEEVPSFFNPLSEPVKKRSYQSTEQTDVGEIEEPDFANKQSATEKLEEFEEEQAAQEEADAYAEMEEEEEEQGSIFDNLRNEGMEELDSKDQKLAAKQLVQTVLDGYEMLHELGKNFVKYPEEKITEKVIKGEIDPEEKIPIDELGNTTNVIEFFGEFNKQAEEAISYDPEFGEKVRPAMERVFAKKGWGMTDEQFLMVAFGKDIAWKSVQIFTLKKTANGIMNTFEELQRQKIEAIRQANRRPAYEQPPLQADTITTPPQQSTVQEEPVQDEITIEAEPQNEETRGYYAADQTSDSTDIVPIHGE